MLFYHCANFRCSSQLLSPHPTLFCDFKTKKNTKFPSGSIHWAVPKRWLQEPSRAPRARICLLPTQHISSWKFCVAFSSKSNLRAAESTQEGNIHKNICLLSPTHACCPFLKNLAKEKASPWPAWTRHPLPLASAALSPSLLMSVVINRSLSLSPGLHSGRSTFPQVNVWKKAGRPWLTAALRIPFNLEHLPHHFPYYLIITGLLAHTLWSETTVRSY